MGWVENDSEMVSGFRFEGLKEEGPPTAMGPNANVIGAVRFFFKY